MSRLDELRSARDSYSVKLREFIQVVTREPDALVCFFEGEDIKYFGPRIDLLSPASSWHGVNCGGKAAVLQLCRLISDHTVHSQAKTAYFIDRDFDEPPTLPPNAQVYITPCYSVENLYATETAFKRVLRSEFQLGEYPDEDGHFTTCLTLFRARLTQFLDCVEMINAWILYHRRKEADGSRSARLNLTNFNPNHLVTVRLDTVDQIYSLFTLQTSVVDPAPVTAEELLEIAKQFDRELRQLTFRGKFQAFFMRAFMNKLAEDANRDVPTHFKSQFRVRILFSDRNFLSELTQHADTPTCLRSFLAGLN